MVASASEKLLCLIIPTFTYLLFSKGESPYDIYLIPRACTWYHKMLQLSSYHMLISVFEALRQLTIVIVRYNLFYIVSMCLTFWCLTYLFDHHLSLESVSVDEANPQHFHHLKLKAVSNKEKHSNEGHKNQGA